MSRLLRATEVIGHPVITVAGDSELEVRDVVFHAGTGSICGFTLRRPGFLGKAVKDAALPWSGVRGLGRDAVVVTGEDALDPDFDARDGDDVLGVHVMTDDGTDIGTVTDLIVEVEGQTADVVGFEIEPSEAIGTDAGHVFIPLPDTIAMSGEHVVVPAGAREFVAADLTGFGGAVERFREQIGGAR